MRGSKSLALLVCFVVAPLGWRTPLAAQCRLCSVPTTSREPVSGGEAISLEVESALAFGRLIVSGDGRGSALLNPDGSTITSGAIAVSTARSMVGSVTVRGEPGRAVRIELPRRVNLYSLDGGQVSISQVVSDLPGYPRLDGAGKLTFRFGGRVDVTGDADGEFRGDLPITVEYL